MIKIKPKDELYDELDFFILDDVVESVERKSRRKRICYRCTNEIQIGEKYISHTFRYDKNAICISFCSNCFSDE